MGKTTFLYLEDGTVYEGISFGHYGESFGEVVFTTGMTGYVESLTDPSFCGQILVFTYPIIGNYGVPRLTYQDKHLVENAESERIWTQGVIVADLSTRGSHYQLYREFSDWLASEKIPGIFGIDTRALTIHLREYGVMRGLISPSQNSPDWKNFSVPSIFSTTISEPVTYAPRQSCGKTVALLDCGVKHGILRSLLRHGYTVIRLPYNVNPFEYSQFDGVFCSNGPGDPKDWKETIHTVRRVIDADVPFIGVCLGNQILALAIGGNTYKLPYGHRGLNQPCQDVTTRRCYLTSQNHGYAVDVSTIPSDYQQWFVNLNDQTNE
ncbi:MAG: glutamine-hydrolyzing carbamoyl-phosphate synthase small subunit, partial [Patescibacteria group bacterium]|nr:glutamine-hydrolyzing carbamoyl-phosphate synthase small subunit [Patescibacteria group bacterium]